MVVTSPFPEITMRHQDILAKIYHEFVIPGTTRHDSPRSRVGNLSGAPGRRVSHVVRRSSEELCVRHKNRELLILENSRKRKNQKPHVRLPNRRFSLERRTDRTLVRMMGRFLILSAEARR